MNKNNEKVTTGVIQGSALEPSRDFPAMVQGGQETDLSGRVWSQLPVEPLTMKGVRNVSDPRVRQ